MLDPVPGIKAVGLLALLCANPAEQSNTVPVESICRASRRARRDLALVPTGLGSSGSPTHNNALRHPEDFPGNAAIALEVVEAALRFIHVLSFQHFQGPVAHLDKWHAEVLAALFDDPGCIRSRLCGAYLRNKARHSKLLDELERPDRENVKSISVANAKLSRWMDDQRGPSLLTRTWLSVKIGAGSKSRGDSGEHYPVKASFDQESP